VGSGLGVDSFIAGHYAGPSGKVVGIDISKAEVLHAKQRAEERKAKVFFMQADMENSPMPDASVDVVISNGAFCLAPNKERAFSEIFRVLKPGGRMAICTSTIKMELKAGVNWPLCMRMFIHISELQPMCAKLGFQNIKIDDSNSEMQFELPEVEEGEGQQQATEAGKKRAKNQVHVGAEEFEHLKDYDMNEICARVTVFATKPMDGAGTQRLGQLVDDGQAVL